MKVIFLFHVANNDLFAFFPADKADNKGNFTSYSHVGQHSACGTDYVQESRLAKEDEYIPLLNEMIYNYGYKDLEILM